MSVAFERQLGRQPGIQLNPTRDNSDGFAQNNSDQVFAIPGRFQRGYIDRCFKVSRATIRQRLGRAEPIRASALNEAYRHVFEGLNNGAFEVIVHRLITSAAVNSFVIVSEEAVTGNLTFSVAETLPASYLFAVKHFECFNDGLILEVGAAALRSGGVEVANKTLTLRLRDPIDNGLLYEVTGSLDSTALDEFGNSAFISDVAAQSALEPAFSVTVPDGATGIKPGSNAYGRDANGLPKSARSSTLIYFIEGGTAYTADDYVRARERLHRTEFDFAYISSGGSQAPALLSNLAQLAFDANKLLRMDISGLLSDAAAIAFVEQLNIDSQYVRAFWSPLEADDPLGGGKAIWGTSGYFIGRACARNAVTDSRGFAFKNEAIGGKAYPLNRTGLKQLVALKTPELDALAEAHICPVLYERYNGGGAYVATDVLTLANTEVGSRKLDSTADMASSLDELITRFAKEILLLPMETAIARMNTYLQNLFEGAQSAGWIIATAELDGAAFAFEVKRNAIRPNDRLDVRYSACFDGVVRQIYVSPTITAFR